jgi:hypothetical protein
MESMLTAIAVGFLLLFAFRAVRIVLLRSAAALLGLIISVLRFFAPSTPPCRPTL